MDEEDFREAADAAKETDEGSKYTDDELRDSIKSTYNKYKDVEVKMNRRNFLKIIGMGAVTGFVAGMGVINYQPGRRTTMQNTPTGYSHGGSGITVPEGETVRISGEHNVGTEGVTVNGELVIEGDTRLIYEGRSGPHQGAIQNGNDISGTVRFENEGDQLIYDQTAEHCAVSTKMRDGGQFGDGRGEIIFEGEADLLNDDNGGAGFMFFPPDSGAAEVNRVAWPYGSGYPWNGEHASNIGFSWAGYDGDIALRNCYIWGFSHNLFYWYRHTGTFTVENCLFEHNGSRGVSVPLGGLEMSDTTIVVGGKNAGQLHNSEPNDLALGTTAFQLDGTGGDNRTANLQNVHVMGSAETCDGEQARYGDGGGGLYGVYYEGDTFTFNLENCHTDRSTGAPSGVTLNTNGSWGNNPQCIENPIDNPRADGGLPSGGSGGGTGGAGSGPSGVAMPDQPEFDPCEPGGPGAGGAGGGSGGWSGGGSGGSGGTSGGNIENCTEGEDYELHTVEAGETFEKSLSDGETWENKIIDISAEGASYRINAVADNWEIRNIGIRGQLDQQAAADTQFFIVRVNSPDATGLIENVYLPGTSYPRSYETSPSGMYVHAYHEGDLEINNFYATDFPSHAIYGSGPGNPSDHSLPGGQGTVRIHNSYTADMENSGWRIGTEGSYVENSVAFRTTRGVWAYYNDVEIRDCDLGENGSDIHVGNGSWGNTGTATVNNTRFDPDNVAEVSGGTLSGSSAGTPEDRVPEGCPTSAKEAACGLGKGSGGSGGGNTGGTSGSETVFFNYDEAAGQGSDHNGLGALYNVGDNRGTGNYAELTSDGPEGTAHNHKQLQYTDGGNSSSGSKSSNTLYKVGAEHGGSTGAVQEIYMEVDVNLTDYHISAQDTDRWMWIMNRDHGGYDATDGTGFSNAIGTCADRGNPPSGHYAMAHYFYDMNGSGDYTPTEAYVPQEGWFTLGVYAKCNDPGSNNGVYKIYVDGELGDRTQRTMVNDRQYMIRDVGFLGYYVDYGGGSQAVDKYRYFDNHRLWVGNDIPSDIRE